MDEPSQTPVSADDADFGARFLERYRQAAKGYAWSYETIQEIKRSNREDLLKLFRGRGLSYEGIQKLRTSTPEEFADWFAGALDIDGIAAVALLGLFT